MCGSAAVSGSVAAAITELWQQLCQFWQQLYYIKRFDGDRSNPISLFEK
jgi:hypothetical protein